MAVTVHLEVKGRPLHMLLDLVELAKVRTRFFEINQSPRANVEDLQSHTGVNLAVAFRDVLQAFGIENKVSGWKSSHS